MCPAGGGPGDEPPGLPAGPLGLGRRRLRGGLRGPVADLPRGLEGAFRQGAKPLADRSLYPSKAALLQKLEEAHARLADAAAKAAPETLAQPAPEKIREPLPHSRRPADRLDDVARGEPQRPAVGVAAGDGIAVGVLIAQCSVEILGREKSRLIAISYELIADS